MNISDVKTGLRYIDSIGVEIEIVALPGKLKSFQCTASDRPGRILRITRLQLIADLNSAQKIFN